MKRILFILASYSCSTSVDTESFKKEIAQIDSMSNYMDSVVFKVERRKLQKGMIYEPIDSYSFYLNSDFPQYAKYRVRHGGSSFIDSEYYYLNDKLIKLTASEYDLDSIKRSTTYYFRNDTVLNSSSKEDTTTTMTILQNASLYLARIKERKN